MSFKLVDDKGSSLNKVNKRRRVEDLLFESIPTSEYILNRSGKYCCKVCPHWPVFDTLAMLTSHRDGKKHKNNNEELNKLKMKKELEKSSNVFAASAGKSETNLAASQDLVIDMHSGSLQHADRKFRNDNKCECRLEDTSASSNKKRKKTTPFFQPIRNYACKCKNKEQPANLANLDLKDKRTTSLTQSTTHKIEQMSSYTQSPAALKFDDNGGKKSKKKKGNNLATRILDSSAVLTPSKEKFEPTLMKYYAKMKQNGWIINSDGEWEKSEDCEFDSDEEAPKYEEASKWNI